MLTVAVWLSGVVGWRSNGGGGRREIAEGLAKNAVVALVDDAEWDMCRPLTGDCNLKICGFDTEVGKKVMWHSTAHMLGEAMEYKYKGELCIGPPIENGFYYDIHLGDGKVSEESFKELETKIEKIAKSKRTFQRMELTKDDARNMFSYNPFKLELIEKLEDTQTITAYRDGPFIDLCRGSARHRTRRLEEIETETRLPWSASFTVLSLFFFISVCVCVRVCARVWRLSVPAGALRLQAACSELFCREGGDDPEDELCLLAWKSGERFAAAGVRDFVSHQSGDEGLQELSCRGGEA